MIVMSRETRDRVRNFLESTSAHGLGRTTANNLVERVFWIAACIAVYVAVAVITVTLVVDFMRNDTVSAILTEPMWVTVTPSGTVGDSSDIFPRLLFCRVDGSASPKEIFVNNGEGRLVEETVYIAVDYIKIQNFYRNSLDLIDPSTAFALRRRCFRPRRHPAPTKYEVKWPDGAENLAVDVFASFSQWAGPVVDKSVRIDQKSGLIALAFGAVEFLNYSADAGLYADTYPAFSGVDLTRPQFYDMGRCYEVCMESAVKEFGCETRPTDFPALLDEEEEEQKTCEEEQQRRKSWKNWWKKGDREKNETTKSAKDDVESDGPTDAGLTVTDSPESSTKALTKSSESPDDSATKPTSTEYGNVHKNPTKRIPSLITDFKFKYATTEEDTTTEAIKKITTSTTTSSATTAMEPTSTARPTNCELRFRKALPSMGCNVTCKPLATEVSFQMSLLDDPCRLSASGLTSSQDVVVVTLNVRGKAQIVEEKSKKNLLDLLAEIGGYLGLFVGISFVTVVEFVIFIVALTFGVIANCRRGSKVKEEEIVLKVK